MIEQSKHYALAITCGAKRGPKDTDLTFSPSSLRDFLKALAEQPAQRKPLTDEQIDRAIAELGLNYFADAANNRAVLRELCRKAAHGIKGDA